MQSKLIPGRSSLSSSSEYCCLIRSIASLVFEEASSSTFVVTPCTDCKYCENHKEEASLANESFRIFSEYSSSRCVRVEGAGQFLNSKKLIDGHIAQNLMNAGRPSDFDVGEFDSAQTEMEALVV
jgi:hypothetical protein